MISESLERRLTALIDPEYEKEVNALIPAAVKFADKQFGKSSPVGSVKVKAKWAANWNYCFHQKREKMYRKRKEN